MTRDSYNRFLRSDIYRDSLVSAKKKVYIFIIIKNIYIDIFKILKNQQKKLSINLILSKYFLFFIKINFS